MTVNKPQTETGFETLAPHQFIRLKTFRKSGLGVATVMWFAFHDGKLYINTASSTGKMKRMRNNGRVQCTPCGRFGRVLGDGTELAGQARVLAGDEAQVVRDLLIQKYGLTWRIFMFVENRRKTPRVFIEIAPRVESDA